MAWKPAAARPHRPPGDHIDTQVDPLLAAIGAKLRQSTNFVFLERLDETQLREVVYDVAHEFLKRWKKAGLAQSPMVALTQRYSESLDMLLAQGQNAQGGSVTAVR